MSFFDIFKRNKVTTISESTIDKQLSSKEPYGKDDCSYIDTDIPNNQKNKEQSQTVFGTPIDELQNKGLYPWANKPIPDTDLKLSHIIMLWWFDEVYKPQKSVPLYFERYYVKSFKIEVRYLIDHSWLNLDKSLSLKAKKILSDNYEYVEKHRNNWTSDEELEKNHNIFLKIQNEHNEWLRSVGLDDIADQNEKYRDIDAKNDSITKPFLLAEKLSKAGKINESLEILLPLLEKAKTIEPYYRGMIVERIAINHRKEKSFKNEIDILEQYLNTMNTDKSFYQYQEKFEKRLQRAQSLFLNQKNSD
ncbi:hypothetical protein ACR77M_06115 [Enterococcus avium]|uniref:hypothetical protein n=1 Tax=Enterococcus avium TaxID=33945 RepID=UPI003DA5CE49